MRRTHKRERERERYRRLENIIAYRYFERRRVRKGYVSRYSKFVTLIDLITTNGVISSDEGDERLVTRGGAIPFLP